MSESFIFTNQLPNLDKYLLDMVLKYLTFFKLIIFFRNMLPHSQLWHFK